MTNRCIFVIGYTASSHQT